MNKLALVVLLLVVVVGVVVQVQLHASIVLRVLDAVVQIQHVSAASAAGPFYTQFTKYKIIATVKMDSDCWTELYARAVPKGHNQLVLNKETRHNNDAPDNGPSEIVRFNWNFKLNKQTDSGSDRTRMYVEIELPSGHNGDTVNKYLPISAAKKKDGIFVLDFQTFYMKTNKDLCA